MKYKNHRLDPLIILTLSLCACCFGLLVSSKASSLDEKMLSVQLISPELQTTRSLAVAEFLRSLNLANQKELLEAWRKEKNQEKYSVNPRPGIWLVCSANRDKFSFDLAVLVEDKTLTDQRRFALVVFNELPGKKYKTNWLLPNTNWDGANLKLNSGGIYLESSSVLCFVRWNSKRQTYYCHKHSV
jgi:hypothetical protein